MGRRLPPDEDKTMRMGHVRHVREEDGRRRPRLRLRVFRWILLAVFLLSALILLLVWVLARFSRTQPPSLTGYVNESIRAFVQSVPAATRFPEHGILLVTADGSRREITLAGEGTPRGLKLSPEGGYALVMMTSASGDRILVRVDLDSGETGFVTMTEAYTHYAWLDEGTFLLFPSLLSEENPLQAIDSRTMQPKELLTLAPEQFHDGGIERIELGALCWDSLGRRYLLVANVYDAETHSATLVVTSYQQDGSFRERLIEKRDMQMPSAGGRVEPQIAVIRSGAIAVSAIERVQGTPYNRVLLYDGYGRLDRAAAGVSLQASGLPAAFYDQNVFAAVSDPVEGDRQDAGNRVWQMREKLADSVPMDAESLGARSGQVYGVDSIDGEQFLLAAYIELTPAAEARTHMIFRYRMDEPGSVEPVAVLPADAQFGGVTPAGELVILTGEEQLSLPNLAERPPIETEAHEGYTAADYTLLRQSAGPDSHRVYFQGTISARISDRAPYTTLTVHTIDGAYQLTNYSSTTLQLQLFAGSYIKVYGHTTGAADGKGVIPIAADYVYAADGSPIAFTEYETVHDCVVAQMPLLERNARNGYGQRFYLIGTVEAVEADQFRIGSYLVRHFTEGIEVGMTLGIEAIFSDKEGEGYVFYPEVIREGENILYNGTERTLDNPGLFARCVGETLIGAAEGTLVHTPMLVGDVLACDLLSAAELTPQGQLQEISALLRSFALQLGDTTPFGTFELNLFTRARDAAVYHKTMTITLSRETLLETGWSTISPADYVERGWLELWEGDLSAITEEDEPLVIPSQILFSLSLDGKEEVTTLASLGEGQRYTQPLYLSDLNKLVFLRRGTALLSEREVALTEQSLAAYSFVAGRVEDYGPAPVQARSAHSAGGSYVYLEQTPSPETIELYNFTAPEAERMTLQVDPQLEVLAVVQEPVSSEYLVLGALREDTASGRAGDLLLVRYFGNGSYKNQRITGMSRGNGEMDLSGMVCLDGTLLFPSGGPDGEQPGMTLWDLEEDRLIAHFLDCSGAAAVEARDAYAMIDGEDTLLIAGTDGTVRYRISAAALAEAAGVEDVTLERLYTVPHMGKLVLIVADPEGGRYALTHSLGSAGSIRFAADLRAYGDHLIAGVSMGEELLLVTPFELPKGTAIA